MVTRVCMLNWARSALHTLSSHEYPCASGGHVLVLVLTMGMSKLHDASAGQCWEACVCTPESGRLCRSRGDLHAGPHCVQTFAAKALPVCLWSFPCFRGRVLSGWRCHSFSVIVQRYLRGSPSYPALPASAARSPRYLAAPFQRPATRASRAHHAPSLSRYAICNLPATAYWSTRLRYLSLL